MIGPWSSVNRHWHHRAREIPYLTRMQCMYHHRLQCARILLIFRVFGPLLLRLLALTLRASPRCNWVQELGTRRVSQIKSHRKSRSLTYDLVIEMHAFTEWHLPSSPDSALRALLPGSWHEGDRYRSTENEVRSVPISMHAMLRIQAPNAQTQLHVHITASCVADLVSRSLGILKIQCPAERVYHHTAIKKAELSSGEVVKFFFRVRTTKFWICCPLPAADAR
jgi:hypothetical protein